MTTYEITKIYHEIISCKTEEDVLDIRNHLLDTINGKDKINSMEMITLQNALQQRLNTIAIEAISDQLYIVATKMYMGQVGSKKGTTSDTETLRLEQMRKEELEEVEKGNVMSMADFARKRDDT